MVSKWFVLGLVVGLSGTVPGLLCAQDSSPAKTSPVDEQSAGTEPIAVDLFTAMRSGQLEVVVIPHSYARVTMRMRNTTREPLRVTPPRSFAAVPTARRQKQQILAQSGHTPSLADGYLLDPNGSQGLAGSFYASRSPAKPAVAATDAGEAASDSAADQPLTWLLGPGQTKQIQLPSLCLEYGKPDPHRRIPYQMVELQDLNNMPAIQELLDRFVEQKLDQRVVQLAAWHVANGVPWQTLARIQLPRSAGRGGGTVSAKELAAARQLSESLPSYGSQPSLSDQR